MTTTSAAPSFIQYTKIHGLAGNMFENAPTPADRRQFRISDEQVKFYNENGYLAPLRLLSDEQVKSFRERLEVMVRSDFPRASELTGSPMVKPGAKLGMIYFQGAWVVDEAFHDLVFSPRLIVPLCQLLGTQKVRFFHDQIFYKPARHGGIVPWHQDYSYWTRTEPAAHITCFLCLDDTNLENGCLHVIPKSHKWKLLPKVDLFGQPETMESIKSVLSPEQLAEFKPQPIFLRAGECSFHHCYTLHGSHPNGSERPRRSVVLNYMKPDVRSASDKPLMPGAEVVPPGQIVDGELFPIAGEL